MEAGTGNALAAAFGGHKKSADCDCVTLPIYSFYIGLFPENATDFALDFFQNAFLHSVTVKITDET